MEKNNLLQYIPHAFVKESRLRTSAKDVVINYIKDEIIQGRLRPGDKLPIEDKLAEQLKVGRGSVREAIKVLQSIGVVGIERGCGTFITKGDISKSMEPLLFAVILSGLSGEQIKELRCMLEYSIYDKVVTSITAEQVQELRKQIQQMEDAIAGSPDLDPQVLVEYDYNFHMMVASYTQNPLVEGLYSIILAISFPMMKEDYNHGKESITANPNHKLICEALESHDPAKARESIFSSMWHKRLQA